MKRRECPAIVALLQQAANLSNETSDRAMGRARKLAFQLHTAEGRINELEADIEQFRDRAAQLQIWLAGA
jgi:hypothetical protein